MVIPAPSLKVAVASLALLGFYGTWGRTIINGSLKLLLQSIHVEGKLSSGDAIVSSITGIYWPIDYLLDVLIVFFFEAVDGSHPVTSFFGLYFAGQHLAVITTLYVASYRTTNYQNYTTSPTLWLLIFQLTAIATSGPWLVAGLLSSEWFFSSDTQYNTASSGSIILLPLSITLTYTVPLLIMALPSPSLVSNHFQQLAIAGWNVFPLFTGLAQLSLPALTTIYYKEPPGKHLQSSRSTLKAIRITYGFAAISCFATHAGFLTLSFATVLFPTIFALGLASELGPARVLRLAFDGLPVYSMGEGVLQFMQWDLFIGFASTLLLAGVRYYRERVVLGQQIGLFTFTAVLVAAVVVLGPGASLIVVNWATDETILQKYTKHTKGL